MLRRSLALILMKPVIISYTAHSLYFTIRPRHVAHGNAAAFSTRSCTNIHRRNQPLQSQTPMAPRIRQSIRKAPIPPRTTLQAACEAEVGAPTADGGYKTGAVGLWSWYEKMRSCLPMGYGWLIVCYHRCFGVRCFVYGLEE